MEPSSCVGILKLNFIGALKGNPSLASFGCVIRHFWSAIMCVCCGPLGFCNSIKAKSMGLLMCLRELRNIGLIGCLVKGDSSSIVNWGMGM